MYDPIVVDTFTRVHSSIAPQSETETTLTSLKAITEAAIGTPPAANVESRTARFEEIAASSDEMLTLFDLARSLTASMGVQDGTELIAKHLRRLIPSSACVFYLYDADQDELVATHASGEHAAHIKGLRIPQGQRLSGWVAANRQTIRNSDPVLDLGESARAMAPRPRSCLSTPLVAGKSLVGVLSLYSSNKDAYSEDHERIIEVIARQVSGAILEAQRAERVRVSSLKDETTGLPNFRHLTEFIEEQLSDDSRRHPFCLITIKFKATAATNFSRATEAIVAATRRALRPADLLFRAADDELVALLLNTEYDSASAVGLRLQSALDVLRRDGTAAAGRLGLACVPVDIGNAARLLALSRERASNDPDSGFSPPKAIH